MSSFSISRTQLRTTKLRPLSMQSLAHTSVLKTSLRSSTILDSSSLRKRQMRSTLTPQTTILRRLLTQSEYMTLATSTWCMLKNATISFRCMIPTACSFQTKSICRLSRHARTQSWFKESQRSTSTSRIRSLGHQGPNRSSEYCAQTTIFMFIRKIRRTSVTSAQLSANSHYRSCSFSNCIHCG